MIYKFNTVPISTPPTLSLSLFLRIECLIQSFPMAMAEQQAKPEAPVVAAVPSNDAVDHKKADGEATASDDSKALVVVPEPESEFCMCS